MRTVSSSCAPDSTRAGTRSTIWRAWSRFAASANRAEVAASSGTFSLMSCSPISGSSFSTRQAWVICAARSCSPRIAASMRAWISASVGPDGHAGSGAAACARASPLAWPFGFGSARCSGASLLRSAGFSALRSASGVLGRRLVVLLGHLVGGRRGGLVCHCAVLSWCRKSAALGMRSAPERARQAERRNRESSLGSQSIARMSGTSFSSFDRSLTS